MMGKLFDRIYNYWENKDMEKFYSESGAALPLPEYNRKWMNLVCAMCHRPLQPDERCECFAPPKPKPQDWARAYAKMDRK